MRRCSTSPGVDERARDGRALELAFDPAGDRRASPDRPHRRRRTRSTTSTSSEPAIEEVIARFYELHGAEEA